MEVIYDGEENKFGFIFISIPSSAGADDSSTEEEDEDHEETLNRLVQAGPHVVVKKAGEIMAILNMQ